MAPLRIRLIHHLGGALVTAATLLGAGAAVAAAPASSCSCTTPTPSPGSGRTYSYGSSSATSTSAASVTVTLRGTGVGGAQAVANSVGGGYGSFSEQGGVTTNIEAVQVEAPAQERRICAAFRAVAQATTIRASCLDDKDVPHPASQVSPERQVANGFEGEIYRCIAGTRLQYTMLQSEAATDGQSMSCRKGEALYHQGNGRLECRAQKPARDCNERSLLRRYGAGLKTLSAVAGQECIAWRTEAAAGPSPTGASIAAPLELSGIQP